MPLVHNERIKLVANAFDRASTACFVIGVIGPIVAAVTTREPPPAVILVGLAFAFVVAGFVLHVVARNILGELRE